MENKIKKKLPKSPSPAYPPLSLPGPDGFPSHVFPPTTRRVPFSPIEFLQRPAVYTREQKVLFLHRVGCWQTTGAGTRGRYFTGLEFLAKSALPAFNAVMYLCTRWLTALCSLDYLWTHPVETTAIVNNFINYTYRLFKLNRVYCIIYKSKSPRTSYNTKTNYRILIRKFQINH